MKVYGVRLITLSIMVGALSMPCLYAQSVEFNPYFGAVWPQSSQAGHLKDNVLWGLRAGFHFDPSFAIETNVGYLNQFEIRGIDPKSRGILWEVGPTYSFSSEDWNVPGGFTPHFSLGAGGITTYLKDSPFTYQRFQTLNFVGGPPQTLVNDVQVRSGDTFFTVSAGGGFKVNPKLVGLRADVRARMLPNYYKSSPIWLEATVGVSFVLGKH